MQLLLWLIACHPYQPDETLPFPERSDDTGTKPGDDTGSSEPLDCPSGVYSQDGELCLEFSEERFVTDAQVLSSTAFDYDQDGDLDLYLGLYNADHDLLLKNTGSGFVDVSDSVGLTAGGSTWAVLSEDFNGDGYDDLAITGDNGTQILQNHSGTTLSVAADLGVSSGSALAFVGDFLFVGSANGLKLFEHSSGFAFGSNVASAHGVTDSGQASGFAVLDADDDGQTDDVFVANMTGGNRLFVQTSSGSFSSQESAYGVAGQSSRSAMGVLTLNFQDDHRNSLYVYYADGSAELFVNSSGEFDNQASDWQVNSVSPACGAAYLPLVDGDEASVVVGRCDENQTLLVEYPHFQNESIDKYQNVAEALNLNQEGMVRNIHHFDVNGDGSNDVVVPIFEGGVTVFYDESFDVQN